WSDGHARVAATHLSLACGRHESAFRFRFRCAIRRGESASGASDRQRSRPSPLEGRRLLRAEMRAVSLVPSLTETLFALGAGDDVVGITDFCIFPEGIDRPRVGGTKNPSVARIRELRP